MAGDIQTDPCAGRSFWWPTLPRVLGLVAVVMCAAALAWLVLTPDAARAAEGGLIMEAECGQPKGTGGFQLCGWIDPRGATVTGCVFEYGAGPSYGREAPCSPSPPYSGENPVEVTALIYGFAGGAKYHYRLIVKGEKGIERGPDRVFTTPPLPPVVSDESVSSVSPQDAVFAARVESEGADTSYQVQIAKSPACLPPPGLGYTTCSETETGDLPGGRIPAGSSVSVSLDLAASGTTLQPRSTYEVRMVAANSAASSGVDGEPIWFTTPEGSAEIAREEAERQEVQKHQEEAAAAHARQEEETATIANRLREEAAGSAYLGTASSSSTSHVGELGGELNGNDSHSAATVIETVRVSASRLVLSLDTQRPGEVTISGRGLRTKRARVVADQSRIDVLLTKAGRDLRKHHRRIEVIVDTTAPGTARVRDSITIRL